MKSSRHNSLRKIRSGGHAGFTLVELMVAMTIGLIILAAVATLFTTSRSTHVLEEGLARVQEAGRFGIGFVDRDVRMAGYLGCVNSKTTTVKNMLNSPTSFGTYFAPGQYISGYAYTGTGTTPTALSDWTPALPSAIFASGEVQPYTDVVVVRHADTTGFTVTTPIMTQTSSALHIGVGNGLKQGDIVIVSDCSGADLFQITGPSDPSISGTLNHNSGVSSPAPGNAAPANLSKKYGTDAQIMKIITRVYYIGTGNSNIPTLDRKEYTPSSSSSVVTKQELVEGVEKMKIVYGIDTDTPSDNTPNFYEPADAVDNAGLWSKVVSVRFGLLVRTNSKVDQALDTKAYTLVGQSVSAPFNDKYRRQVYTATVKLRNVN
ncbi:MAG: PilW family protein [Sulfuricaulis sp.]